MTAAVEFGIEVLGTGLVFGLFASVFLVLATSAVCAVVHTLKSVMSGGR